MKLEDFDVQSVESVDVIILDSDDSDHEGRLACTFSFPSYNVKLECTVHRLKREKRVIETCRAVRSNWLFHCLWQQVNRTRTRFTISFNCIMLP